MIGYDSSSLVIDNWCDEALGGGAAVTYFYPDFSALKKLSPVNMLSFLLRQPLNRSDKISQELIQAFREKKSHRRCPQ